MKSCVSMTLPPSLKCAAKDFARRDGLSLGRDVAQALAEMIGARSAAEFFPERGRNGDPERAVAFLEGRLE